MAKTGLFGTDGIRTKVGNYPLTSQALPLLGRAIAHWAYEKYGKDSKILIASDTRYSCDWIKMHLAGGFLEQGLSVFDTGILPTPGLYHLIKKDPSFSCGIMISASHNSSQDNGIKIVDRVGKITKIDEERIQELFLQPSFNCDYAKLGKMTVCETAQADYSASILSHFPAGFLKGTKIVLDCAHGATSSLAPVLFEKLGAHVITLHNEPDGYNINKHCGALHLESLSKSVIQHKALMGFAFDGDGDRVMLVNQAGETKDGDDILALLLTHPDYKNERGVVSTIMANQGCEAHVTSLGKEFIRTAVGDKHIVEALTTQKLLLGAEPSGHIILNDIIATGDGMLAALKIAQAIFLTGNMTCNTFKKFPQYLINVQVKQQKSLNDEPIRAVIASHEQQLDKGRLLVRYSGTEPLIRVMVEDSDAQGAQNLAQSLAQKLSQLLA